MAVEYTPEQKKAIETLDKSVLVSAAAGSGKTAILVERILRIILEGRANVDELLVVTFTRAAAAEMKLRLAAAIRKRMREEPEDAGRLRDQLSRLYRAYITTIDSFALRVIREFFYETDGEPDFRACDEIQGELMRREAMAQLFEAGFEDDHFLDVSGEGAGGAKLPENADAEAHRVIAASSPDTREAVNSVGFREFLRLYSEERNDEGFRDKLLDSYAGLRTIPDYFEWAYDKAEGLRVTEESFAGSDLAKAITSDAVEAFTGACGAADRMRKLFEEAGLEKMFEDKLAAECAAMHDMRDELLSGGLDRDLMERAGCISYVTLRASGDDKESYAAIKKEVAALRDIYKGEIRDWVGRYMTPDLETRLSEMNETYRYTVYYIRLLEEFERRYMAKKRERRVMDFSDMEHNAVRILRREEAAETLRKRFRYIFVDEYQDTNRIQEELISSVARPDNVFRVGDVKQSIYKFRQAEPEIFQELYGRFSSPELEDGVAIDLGRNFRSNDRTIKYINRVFSEVMEGYDDRAKLYTGTPCDPDYDFIPEVHLLTTDDAVTGETGAGSSGGGDVSSGGEAAGGPADAESAPAVSGPDIILQDPDVDEDIVSLSKEEAEADYIAGIVQGLIGTDFYDTKAKEVRKVKASDIIILFRAVKTRGDIMSAALRKRGVEPHVEESDDYFDTVEIGIAMSILSCIDNMKRDVPLIATLHSEVFGWSPAELAEVRIAHTEHQREVRAAEKAAESSGSGDGSGGSEDKPYIRPAYWEALKWYIEDGPEGELKDKAHYAESKLLEWRRQSHMMALDDFVWHVLVDSGYYRMAGAMHGGARRQANLRTLADRARKYSSETIASLSSYITFVDMMRKKGISTGQTPVSAGDEVVRISTIHKSKGLEYPFVIVGGLGHRFRKDNNDKSLSFDSSLGIGLPYIDPSRRYWRSTLIQRAINSKSNRDGYSEELRVLYVAMTRARNKLIMVGSYTNEAKLAEYTARPECYLRVMRDVLKTPYNEYHVSPLDMSGAEKSSSTLHIPDPDSIVLTAEEEELYREIDRRFTYEYPDRDLLTSKAKYSVSELRREALRKEAEQTEDHGGGAGAKNGADAGATEPVGQFFEIPAASAADGEVVDTGDLSDISSVSRRTVRKKDRTVSAADIGTAYHRIMEFIDFARAAGTCEVDEEYIKEQADLLAENGAIAPEVYSEIDTAKIAGFFRTDIGVRAADAARRGVLRKEKAFTLKTGHRAYADDQNGGASSAGSAGITAPGSEARQILVQGVIDCCFEEGGKMILIDYKSGFVRPGSRHAEELERIRHEYRVQIELYSEAVMKGTGMEVSEAYLYMFSSGEALRMDT